MKTILDEIRDDLNGRFDTFLDRLNSLLTKLDDLNLLEQIRQFVMSAASLFDVEKFTDFLLQGRAKTQTVLNEQAL